MASSNKSPYSSAHFSAAKHKKKGGPVFYSGGDSNEASEISVRAHKRRAGGSVPGFASGGRADRHKRGRADAHPFTSAADHVDMGRTTTNVGRSPGGTGAGHPGSHHLAGGHRGHKLSGHHGTKDHPGHHFQTGGRMVYSGRGSNVAEEAGDTGSEHEHGHGPVVAHELVDVHASGARRVRAHRLTEHFQAGGIVRIIEGAGETAGRAIASHAGKSHKHEKCKPGASDDCDDDDPDMDDDEE